MIRYVSEKDVNLDPPSPHKKTLSLQRSAEFTRPLPDTSQHNHSSTQALRNLRKANDQSELLKGRLSILQLHEERNDFKAFLNEQRYQFHQEMRDEMEKDRERKALHLKKMMEKIHENQEQAKFDRLQHQRNLKQANAHIYNNKVNDYQVAKERLKLIQKSVAALKQEDSERKKQRKEEIRQYQRSQRNNVQEYLSNKIKALKHNDSEESVKISRIRDQKYKQLEQLSKLEGLMIERQARSKLTSEESQNKLTKLLGKANKKPVSTSHTTKLPSINNPEKRNNSEQDVLVI